MEAWKLNQILCGFREMLDGDWAGLTLAHTSYSAWGLGSLGSRALFLGPTTVMFVRPSGLVGTRAVGALAERLLVYVGWSLFLLRQCF